MIPHAIPVFRELLLREDLTKSDLLAYGVLAALGGVGEHDPPLERIGEVLGWTVTHTSRVVASLERAGLIDRLIDPGHPARYELRGPVLLSEPGANTPWTVAAS